MKKKILITGINNGLGYDILKFLSKKKKFKISGISNKNSKKKLKNNIEIFYLDFFKTKDISLNFGKSKYHEFDTIIHCAGGGLGYRSNLISVEEMNKLMNLNFISIFELNKILISKKKKNKRLNIIHIGSIAGQEVKASIGYSASKAALTSYNKNLAHKYFKSKVYTKLLIPGSFLSTNGSMHKLKKNKINVFKRIENQLISKNMITSKKLMPLIEFLISNNSDLLSGTIISATNLETLSNY